jgi:predicted AAA+ superfamily ATPase
VPAFEKKTKRRLVLHPKFYFLDAGVYRAIRPMGPLDGPADVGGPALETLVLQELRAALAYSRIGYKIHHWRASSGAEVDFVLCCTAVMNAELSTTLKFGR